MTKEQRHRKKWEAQHRPLGDTHRQIDLTRAQYWRRQRQIWESLQFRVDNETKRELKQEAWEDEFYSSNVWKFKIRNNNLMVAFLNGSIYIYFGAGKLFIGMYNAGSKGKYVWRQLRRKGVAYKRLV